MTEVTEALSKVQAQAAQRRLRFDDFFEDFDRLRSGRITREQFLRALNTLQVNLTDGEKAALVSAFTVPSRAGGGSVVEVNYQQFLQAMRSAPTTFQAAMTRAEPTTTLTQEEEDRLAPAMKMLRQAVQARSTSLTPPFRDLDPHSTGRVTAAQFERCMPFSTMDANLVKLMAKKYSDGNGNVFYMAWCRDVDPSLTVQSQADAASYLPGGPTSATFIINGTYRNPNLSADELLRVLREQFALYKLRCEDYLTDFDRFKTGIISAPQFESALGRLSLVKFALTPENVSTLVQAYAVDPTEPGDVAPPEATIRVQYRAFLHDSNPKNFPVQSATGKPSSNYFLSTHAPDTFVAADDDDEKAKLESILGTLRRRIVSDRVYLTPVFKDFDRVRKDIHEHRTCTASRFARTLATQKLLLSAEDMALLIRKYTVPHPDGSASDEVNYYQFVIDVDPSQAGASADDKAATGASTMQASARMTSRGAVAELQREADDSRLRPADTLEGVLQKIGLQAEKKHLRLGEYFVDFDTLRCGSVLPEQFTTALSLAGVHLQGSELQLLRDAYPSPAGRGKKDLIDYNAFLKAAAPYAPGSVNSQTLLAAATASAAAAAAGGSGGGLTSVSGIQRTVSNAPPLVLTAEEQDLLVKVQDRLIHDVRSHNALLAPFFTDFDKFRNGRISKTNFVQALVRHRFVLSDAETNLLCAFYAVPEDREQIEYRRFIRDVGFEEAKLPASTSTGENGANTYRTSGAALGRSIDGAEQGVSEESVDEVLQRICCFMQERRPRLQEFFPDGDELKHQHVSQTRFRHAVGILGIPLTAKDYATLEAGFACEMVPGEIDYPAFVTTIRAMLEAGEGVKAVTQRRMGASKAPLDLTTAAAASANTAALSQKDAMYVETMNKIRRALTGRRVTSLPAFREYDRKRRGTMTEGQFFACLSSLGVHLTPQEATVVTQAYGLGGGEMGYIRFSDVVDDPAFAAVS